MRFSCPVSHATYHSFASAHCDDVTCNLSQPRSLSPAHDTSWQIIRLCLVSVTLDRWKCLSSLKALQFGESSNGLFLDQPILTHLTMTHFPQSIGLFTPLPCPLLYLCFRFANLCPHILPLNRNAVEYICANFEPKPHFRALRGQLARFLIKKDESWESAPRLEWGLRCSSWQPRCRVPKLDGVRASTLSLWEPIR